MSEPVQEVQTEAPAQEQASTEAPAQTEAPWAPSRDEWGAITQGMAYLAQQGLFDPYEEEPEEEEVDPSDLDLGQLTQKYVDKRLRDVEPYVQAAARQAGEARLNELLDDFEQRPEVGKLDKETRRAVGFVAEAMLSRTGSDDPRAAVQSVYEAAKFLGGLTKSQRESAVEEFKSSFKKNPYTDPDAGVGERSREPAKTYDEVIARYTGDEEV